MSFRNPHESKFNQIFTALDEEVKQKTRNLPRREKKGTRNIKQEKLDNIKNVLIDAEENLKNERYNALIAPFILALKEYPDNEDLKNELIKYSLICVDHHIKSGLLESAMGVINQALNFTPDNVALNNKKTEVENLKKEKSETKSDKYSKDLITRIIKENLGEKDGYFLISTALLREAKQHKNNEQINKELVKYSLLLADQEIKSKKIISSKNIITAVLKTTDNEELSKKLETINKLVEEEENQFQEIEKELTKKEIEHGDKFTIQNKIYEFSLYNSRETKKIYLFPVNEDGSTPLNEKVLMIQPDNFFQNLEKNIKRHNPINEGENEPNSEAQTETDQEQKQEFINSLIEREKDFKEISGILTILYEQYDDKKSSTLSSKLNKILNLIEQAKEQGELNLDSILELWNKKKSATENINLIQDNIKKIEDHIEEQKNNNETKIIFEIKDGIEQRKIEDGDKFKIGENIYTLDIFRSITFREILLLPENPKEKEIKKTPQDFFNGFDNQEIKKYTPEDTIQNRLSEVENSLRENDIFGFKNLGKYKINGQELKFLKHESIALKKFAFIFIDEENKRHKISVKKMRKMCDTNPDIIKPINEQELNEQRNEDLILELIYQKGFDKKIDAKEIRQRIGITIATANVILQKLESKGLVGPEENDNHQRTIKLNADEAGEFKSLQEMSMAEMDEYFEEIKNKREEMLKDLENKGKLKINYEKAKKEYEKNKGDLNAKSRYEHAASEYAAANVNDRLNEILNETSIIEAKLDTKARRFLAKFEKGWQKFGELNAYDMWGWGKNSNGFVKWICKKGLSARSIVTWGLTGAGFVLSGGAGSAIAIGAKFLGASTGIGGTALATVGTIGAIRTTRRAIGGGLMGLGIAAGTEGKFAKKGRKRNAKIKKMFMPGEDGQIEFTQKNPATQNKLIAEYQYNATINKIDLESDDTYQEMIKIRTSQLHELFKQETNIAEQRSVAEKRLVDLKGDLFDKIKENDDSLDKKLQVQGLKRGFRLARATATGVVVGAFLPKVILEARHSEIIKEAADYVGLTKIPLMSRFFVGDVENITTSHLDKTLPLDENFTPDPDYSHIHGISEEQLLNPNIPENPDGFNPDIEITPSDSVEEAIDKGKELLEQGNITQEQFFEDYVPDDCKIQKGEGAYHAVKRQFIDMNPNATPAEIETMTMNALEENGIVKIEGGKIIEEIRSHGGEAYVLNQDGTIDQITPDGVDHAVGIDDSKTDYAWKPKAETPSATNVEPATATEIPTESTLVPDAPETTPVEVAPTDKIISHNVDRYLNPTDERYYFPHSGLNAEAVQEHAFKIIDNDLAQPDNLEKIFEIKDNGLLQKLADNSEHPRVAEMAEKAIEIYDKMSPTERINDILHFGSPDRNDLNIMRPQFERMSEQLSLSGEQGSKINQLFSRFVTQSSKVFEDNFGKGNLTGDRIKGALENFLTSAETKIIPEDWEVWQPRQSASGEIFNVMKHGLDGGAKEFWIDTNGDGVANHVLKTEQGLLELINGKTEEIATDAIVDEAPELATTGIEDIHSGPDVDEPKIDTERVENVLESEENIASNGEEKPDLAQPTETDGVESLKMEDPNFVENAKNVIREFAHPDQVKDFYQMVKNNYPDLVFQSQTAFKNVLNKIAETDWTVQNFEKFSDKEIGLYSVLINYINKQT